MNIRELGRLLRTGQTSAVELVTRVTDDIRTKDKCNSLITSMREQAIAKAAVLDKEMGQGLDRGPFHGIPIAVKDLFYTRGTRTTAGSLLYRDFVPGYDAVALERLEARGAVCIGKTNLHELAYGVTSKNPHFGFVLNPHDTARIAGGSSGGSATLVAAGFLPMCLGTDTGGSIRIPASFCGIAGLKPTYGRVSVRGVLPLAFSLDHAGPLGSCVEDCALAMEAMTGESFLLPPIADFTGARVGVPRNFFFDRVDEEISGAVKQVVRHMEHRGAIVEEIAVPDFEAINAVARIVQMGETAAVYAGVADTSLISGDVRALLEQGKMIAAHEYVNAQRLRSLFRNEFDAVWRRVSFLITPTTPIAAPRVEETTVRIGAAEEDTRLAATRLVRGFNLLGEPALSIPCGKTRGGLPIGLQLVSAPWSEPRLLQVARLVEELLSRSS